MRQSDKFWPIFLIIDLFNTNAYQIERGSLRQAVERHDFDVYKQ